MSPERNNTTENERRNERQYRVIGGAVLGLIVAGLILVPALWELASEGSSKILKYEAVLAAAAAVGVFLYVNRRRSPSD